MKSIRIIKSALKRLLGINRPLPELQYVSTAKRAKMLKQLYKQRMNQELNLKNPKLFTEKLQWIKLYYSHPDMKRCVDKIDFKDYVKEKIGDGYTTPVIAIWNSPDEVSIRDLPGNKFVIKSTLQSDGHMIWPIANINEVDTEQLEKEIKRNCFDTRKLLTNSFCSAYYGAKPRVVVEQFIEEFANVVNDYKLFCFHGRPAFFYVAEDHFKNGKITKSSVITFYDLNWKMMDVKYGEHAVNPDVPTPYHKEQMIVLAIKLAEPFPFVRVDFFDTKDKLYLAELTFYPGGGTGAILS